MVSYQLCLRKVPDELILILEMLSCKKSENLNKNNQDFFKNVNWNEFVEMSIHHRLFPSLFLKIKEEKWGFIPQQTMALLSQYVKINTMNMLSLSGEMGKLGTLFNQHSIPALFLKGPILGAELYGSLSLRTSSDIDVLVSIKDLNKVEQMMKVKGYIKDDYFSSVLNDWKWRHHHVTFNHPETKMKVEIHWRLNPGPAKQPAFKELWERRRVSTFSQSPIFYLSKEDLFFFLVTHGARHGWSRIRWVMDIHQLVQQDLDWNKVMKVLRSYGYLDIGGQALILTNRLFKTPISSDMEPLFQRKRANQLAHKAIFYLEEMINLHTEPVPIHVSKYHQRHLFDLMSAKQKCLFALSLLHPYPVDSETMPLPKNLHFLYVPLRPFLWTWRKSKAIYNNWGT
ncbi:nucleotidyltransferase domain-containing protein [Metabacillus sp. 113a]|uniref:nucleotidyltransferase domain-containing protein n=1 Tax=Metabacillus sp. 113a TaxID=3404706 RepID=UPI003CF89C11